TNESNSTSYNSSSALEMRAEVNTGHTATSNKQQETEATTSNGTSTPTTSFSIQQVGPTTGGDYTEVYCPANTRIIGGGCESTGTPMMPLSQNRPF
ncbi:unnamed protein product, partial [Amoebophrya sp. A25]